MYFEVTRSKLHKSTYFSLLFSLNQGSHYLNHPKVIAQSFVIHL